MYLNENEFIEDYVYLSIVLCLFISNKIKHQNNYISIKII